MRLIVNCGWVGRITLSMLCVHKISCSDFVILVPRHILCNFHTHRHSFPIQSNVREFWSNAVLSSFDWDSYKRFGVDSRWVEHTLFWIILFYCITASNNLYLYSSFILQFIAYEGIKVYFGGWCWGALHLHITFIVKLTYKPLLLIEQLGTEITVPHALLWRWWLPWQEKNRINICGATL